MTRHDPRVRARGCASQLLERLGAFVSDIARAYRAEAEHARSDDMRARRW